MHKQYNFLAAPGNFMTQVINRQTRGDALLDLLLTDKKEAVEWMKIKGSFGWSDQETVKIKGLREFNKTELQLWSSGLMICGT